MKRLGKRSKIAIAFFIISLLLLWYGLAFLTAQQINDNRLVDFSKQGEHYVATSRLSSDQGKFYLVAKCESEKRYPALKSVSVEISGSEGDMRKIELKSSDHKTLRKTKSYNHGWISLIYDFDVDKEDIYTIKVIHIEATSKLERVNFSLHAHSRHIHKNIITIAGFLLLCVSIFALVILGTIYGLHKLYSLTKLDS